MKDQILYHGSKGGIYGEIEPCSRDNCDFGKGFYMGTEIMQAKSLVANDGLPYVYKLYFKLSEIPEERILHLEGRKWLEFILANRKCSKEFNKLNMAKYWLQEQK